MFFLKAWIFLKAFSSRHELRNCWPTITTFSFPRREFWLRSWFLDSLFKCSLGTVRQHGRADGAFCFKIIRMRFEIRPLLRGPAICLHVFTTQWLRWRVYADLQIHSEEAFRSLHCESGKWNQELMLSKWATRLKHTRRCELLRHSSHKISISSA